MRAVADQATVARVERMIAAGMALDAMADALRASNPETSERECLRIVRRVQAGADGRRAREAALRGERIDWQRECAQ